MVCDFHLGEDCCAIVGYCYVAVGGDEDFVETAGAETGFDDGGDCSGGDYVVFYCFEAVCAGFFALIADDYEGPAGFVFRYLGCGGCVSEVCRKFGLD